MRFPWEKEIIVPLRPGEADLDWLPDAIRFPDLPAMKTHGNYQWGGPEGAVIHYTAGNQDGTGRAQVKHALEYGHCYFVIDKHGNVYQQFPLSRYGAHAGKSCHPDTGRGRVSKFLVGIEVMCAGKLELENGHWVTWWKQPVTNVRKHDSMFNIQGGTYQKFTQAQEMALVRLLCDLCRFSPAFRARNIFGHDEVSPGRKTDPGASLSVPMFRLRQKIEGLERMARFNAWPTLLTPEMLKLS